jgi:hypothetical protein
MSKENKGGKYRLVVPLDAAEIPDFKPDKGVKVGVQDRSGRIQARVVNLDPKGNGVATFDFDEQPGALRLIVGPEDAADEELVGLQTITAEVHPKQWQLTNELKLTPIKITPYYWWWWWWWCRKYTINGRILCPDGSPVPGAVVCAYDVDWWWWWVSKQQVGNCATTDATGSFTINFRWCCGWWPWWWWRFHYWQYEPLLAQRILPVLQRDPSLGKLQAPSPLPDLTIFEKLLREDKRLDPSKGESIRSLASSASLLASASRETSRTGSLVNIDPNVLAGLRDRLVERLPAAPELEKLKLWPWWPWQPWWDCSPDIIFRATQDCFEPNKVIVNETIWETRWDVPATLNVTLTATDACCIPICTDPADCPEGDCMVITQACGVLVNNIGGNPGAPVNPAGYVNPGSVSAVGDRPFSDHVSIAGVFGTGAAVDYYEFEWALGIGGPWNPMPPIAAGGFTRWYWGPILPAGPLPPNWHPEGFGFTNISGRNVIESREHFEATNGAGTWGVTRFWGSNRDMLMNWLTNGTFADGTYYLRVRGWDLVGGNLTNDRILPLCDTVDDNYIVLTIDNRTTDGSDGHPAPNTLGHPCGSGTIHTCTMEPDTDIANVTIGGVSVGPCTNVQAAPGSPLVVDFFAYDPDGHLSQYSLIATYGENLYRDLISLADSIVPIGGTGVPIAAQEGPDYGAALAQGATSPIWRGGGIRLTINDSSIAFPEPCCYQLELRAYKRTIVGCHGGLAHNNLSEYSFGVNGCP